MELPETIKSINQQLVDEYGIDTTTGQSIYQVVWAADEYEKRRSKFTPEGFELLYAEVMLLPKYPQNDLDYKERYILEKLVVVPEFNSDELLSKLSYEPIWVFRDRFNNYLPPTFWACKFCIDTVNAAMGKSSLNKYVDESNTPEAKEERIQKLELELFGNETPVGDALAHSEGVGYTGPPLIESSQLKKGN